MTVPQTKNQPPVPKSGNPKNAGEKIIHPSSIPSGKDMLDQMATISQIESESTDDNQDQSAKPIPIDINTYLKEPQITAEKTAHQSPPSPIQMRDFFIDENIKKNKAKQLTIHVSESESTKIVYDMITEFSLITGFAPSDSFVGNMLLIMGRLIHDNCPNYRVRLDHELGNLNSVNSVYKKQDEIQDFLLRILCDMLKDEYALKLRKELKL